MPNDLKEITCLHAFKLSLKKYIFTCFLIVLSFMFTWIDFLVYIYIHICIYINSTLHRASCKPVSFCIVTLFKYYSQKIYITFIDKKYYARYKCHNYIYTTNTYSTFYRIHFYIWYNSSERFINSLFSS